MSEKKKTPGRPKTHSEAKAPVVKEVKVEEVAHEDEDKSLIVLIAIAILIIIGTVIGLLVGCQKEEQTNETPEENKTDVIEIPVTDKTDEEEDNNVIRTDSSTTTTKYQITYILDGERVYSANLSSGSKVKKYVPSGYEDCTYYKDSEHSENFDFSVLPEDDMKVYLVCHLKEYTVTYKDSDGSELSSETLKGTETEGYKVEGLAKAKFLGWSANGNSKIDYKAGQKINVNKNLTLTAVYGETTVVYKSAIVKTKKAETEVEGNTTSEDQVETENVVIGDKTYVDEVEVAYTQEEIDNYALPEDPSEVGLETPTYFIPVPEETETSMVIVSDDTEEVGERQVKLGDVQGRTPDWYAPAVNDNVEEKDCEFVGWTVNDEPAPADYKPSTTGENEVVAAYQIPEEDQEPPKVEETNDNSSESAPTEEPPQEPAPEQVVTE